MTVRQLLGVVLLATPCIALWISMFVIDWRAALLTVTTLLLIVACVFGGAYLLSVK